MVTAVRLTLETPVRQETQASMVTQAIQALLATQALDQTPVIQAVLRLLRGHSCTASLVIQVTLALLVTLEPVTPPAVAD